MLGGNDGGTLESLESLDAMVLLPNSLGSLLLLLTEPRSRLQHSGCSVPSASTLLEEKAAPQQA